MRIEPVNASELANIAREVGAKVLEGNLRYPSQTGNWELGSVDLSEYLDRYRGQRLMVALVPLGEAEEETFTCGVCGFVMDELQECPRCKLTVKDRKSALERQAKGQKWFSADLEGITWFRAEY